jgi:type VI secretion system protein ImpA
MQLDIDALLAPIPGENPSGEDLRYTSVYEEIKEARRSDDALDRGAWKHDIKTSDWQKVITLARDSLIQKTKDLQLAAWLTEALINTEGFDGLASGLRILNGFLSNYWEHVYPVIEEGDIEFRTAPFEFMNDKLWSCIKQLPMTDAQSTPGYSWFQWQQSREVGFEADTRNQYGDVDEKKKSKRDEMMAEGKLPAEDFDAAVTKSPRSFYESLAETLGICRDEFKQLDTIVDEKFGAEAPRLSELGNALEDCERLVVKILKEKREQEPNEEPISEADKSIGEMTVEEDSSLLSLTEEEALPSMQIGIRSFSDNDSSEKIAWHEALKMMNNSGMKKALVHLLTISNSAPSIRERNRYRLLVAKLCLKAKRPDLARPLLEQLHALLEELHLDRWESPLWIAEVLDAYYLCLTSGEPSEGDLGKAKELFQRLCTNDVTKAISYKS